MENNNRGRPSLPPKKHIDFKCCKDNTIKSLSEVECFLCNIKRTNWYIRLLKLFK